MSPRYFSKLNRNRLLEQRQTESLNELEDKIGHAVSFAFSPVVHPVKTWRGLVKFFRPKDRQSS